MSVVVYEDQGLKRSQQIFADLNRHALKPTESLALLSIIEMNMLDL